MSAFGKENVLAIFYQADLIIRSHPSSVWSFVTLERFLFNGAPVRAGQARDSCLAPRGARGQALCGTRERVTDRN